MTADSKLIQVSATRVCVSHLFTQVCQREDGVLGVNVICPVNVSEVPGGTLPDIQVTDFAIEFLRNRSAHREQPFFLGVGFQKPGIPFMYPREYLGEVTVMVSGR